MKTEKITVNKTAERPEGIEIDVVVPETPLEEKLISFLLTAHIRELKQANRLPYDLPQQLIIDHRGKGTFLLSGMVDQGGYYEPPQPIAIVGLRSIAAKFDLIHAPAIRPQPPQQPADAPAAAPEASNS